MTSMVWLKPDPNNVDHYIENMQVYKRFDGADFKVLMNCLEAPDKKWTTRDDIRGEYLYLSFLDGSRYIIDFSFSIHSHTVLLPNGPSKRLYELLTKKQISPEYSPPPLPDPNGILFNDIMGH